MSWMMMRRARGSEQLNPISGVEGEAFASAQEFFWPTASRCTELFGSWMCSSRAKRTRSATGAAKADIQIPIVFLTGHGDIPTSVRAIKAGALEFLTKPFNDEDLLDAIQQGIAGISGCRSKKRILPPINWRHSRQERRTKIRSESS
jgi:FixJ family two-component response regulator